MDAPSDPAEPGACPACAHPLQGGERFCPSCGQALGAPPKCPHCAAALKPEDRFCHRCGASLQSPELCPACGAAVPAGAPRCPACEILLVGLRPEPDAIAPLEVAEEPPNPPREPTPAAQSSGIGANVLVFVAVAMLVVVGVYELSKVQHAPPPAGMRPRPAPTATAAPLAGGIVALPPGVTPPEGATLFISLRAPAGGPPVAAIRVDQPRFPVRFVITTANLMMPGQTPGGPFLIQARLDQDGDARTRAEGELSARGLEPVPKGSMKLSLTLRESD